MTPKRYVMSEVDPRVWCGLHQKLEPLFRVGVTFNGRQHIFNTNCYYEIKGKSLCGHGSLDQATDLSIPAFGKLRPEFCRACIRLHSDDEKLSTK